MIRKKGNHIIKKVSDQSIIGQKGINLIEQIVLEMGFVWTQTRIEAGTDGIIELRDDSTKEATNFIINVQSKASETQYVAKNRNTFSYICKKEDLEYWLKGNCPVILVCSNVKEKKAYWVSIKDYFEDPRRRKTRKITFSKVNNLFTVGCKDELFKLLSSSRQKEDTNWGSIANNVADYIWEHLFDAHRGAFPFSEDITVVFGNDGYESEIVQKEISLFTKSTAMKRIKVLGFGISEDNYTWCLLLKTNKFELLNEVIWDFFPEGGSNNQLQKGIAYTRLSSYTYSPLNKFFVVLG